MTDSSARGYLGPTWLRALLVVPVAWILGGSLFVATGHASDRLSLGIGIHQRSFDTMSYGDVRPLPRGEFGGRAEVGYRIAGRWWTVLSGHFGGSWFDFNEPEATPGLVVSGKIDDFTWMIRGGLDRRGADPGRPSWYYGIGAEYGESRSWLDSFATSDEGPHVFMGGAYLKLGATAPLFGPLRGYVEVFQSAYHAHARRARFQEDFNWLGRSIEGGAGISMAFMSSRSAE